jgi:hypothetical protein
MQTIINLPQLNTCQINAKHAIEAWLLDPSRKEFILMGGPGVGKSFVINNVLNDLQGIKDIAKILGTEFNIINICNTATTNKAAGVIGGKTIYATLGLGMFNDYKTGEVKINSRNATYLYNSLVILDEASMVDPILFNMVQKYVKDECKILYVLDPDQLPPVGETTIPVIQTDIDRVELVTQERQDPNSHLYKTLQEVKAWVRGGSVPNIIEGTDIEYVSDEGLNNFIMNMTSNDKIITYTNDSCISLGTHTRTLLGLPLDFYREGEIVTSNSSNTSLGLKSRIYTDVDYEISHIGQATRDYENLEYRLCKLGEAYFRIPTCSKTYMELLKHYKNKKDWKSYFFFKDNFIDVRSSHVISAHKSQGSTFDNVLINLANLNRCPDKDLLKRLLYVAMSRARNKVYLYGKLTL